MPGEESGTRRHTGEFPTSNGQAFVYVFPFGILRTEDEIEPQLFTEDTVTVRLYAPHVNGDELSSGRPVDYERIPSRPFASIPTNSLIRLTIKRELPQGAKFVMATALRVDVYGNMDSRSLGEAADRAVSRFLRNCRLWLRQWWITRGDSDDEGTRRISFEVDQNGHPVTRESAAGLAVRTRLQSESLLTPDVFRFLIHVMRAGNDASLSGNTLLDSVYHAAMDELPRAVLDAAIACEALLREESFRRVDEGVVSEDEVRRALTGQPLKLANLGNATRIAFGTSFPAAFPAVAGLNRLQTVRNYLAHGNARQLQQASEIRDHAAYEVLQRAAFDLFEWAATARARTLPDPVLAFIRPMVPPEVGDPAAT